jgi:hypothetical protein
VRESRGLRANNLHLSVLVRLGSRPLLSRRRMRP